MKVKLKFYSGLEKYIRNYQNKEIIVTLNKNDSLKNIITRFLPSEMLNYIYLLVDNQIVNQDYQVLDGDEIKIFLLLIGG